MKKLFFILSIVFIVSCNPARDKEGYEVPSQIKILTVDGDTAIIYNDSYKQTIRLKANKNKKQ